MTEQMIEKMRNKSGNNKVISLGFAGLLMLSQASLFVSTASADVVSSRDVACNVSTKDPVPHKCGNCYITPKLCPGDRLE